MTMTDQMPTPFGELVGLHLYLSSITGLMFVVLFAIFLKQKKLFSWNRFLIVSSGYYIITNILSFFIWVEWPFKVDIMFGFIHLPTLIVSFLIVLLTARFIISAYIQRD
jgi:hypothetical protein